MPRKPKIKFVGPPRPKKTITTSATKAKIPLNKYQVKTTGVTKSQAANAQFNIETKKTPISNKYSNKIVYTKLKPGDRGYRDLKGRVEIEARVKVLDRSGTRLDTSTGEIGPKKVWKGNKRVTVPLEKFGVKFSYKIKNKLPLTILGTQSAEGIKYLENKGSAQCKSSIMLAALNASGTTSIKAKKSRNHTELLFKYLKIPIKVRKTKKFDFIDIKKPKKINAFNYQIPGDISSSAFFMVLTMLANNSKLLIKNVNINPSRVGVITILKKMGAQITLKNQKNYRGEKISDILIKSSKKLKAINCPAELNSSAIDEFLVIFLIAAKAKGISYFKDLSELNQKESPRLIWGSKILNMMGIKTDLTKDSIKIYGQPNLEIKKPITIKNYLKDHRVFMMSAIAALTFGGKWKIHDKDSINTSFPSFLKIIKNINHLSL